MPDRDEALRKLMREYSEQYGQSLLEEQSALKNSGTLYPTGGLDQKVGQVLAARRRRPRMRAAAVLAACIALVVLVPQVLRRGALTPSEPGAPSSALEPSQVEMIPLAFTLPEGFTLAGAQQDNEKSIYHLTDAMDDDVVITLEKSSAPLNTRGLVSIATDGGVVWGTQTDAYSLLMFEKDEVIYTMTCRHDINTLMRLSAAAL